MKDVGSLPLLRVRVECCESPDAGFTEFPEWDPDWEIWMVSLECLACGKDSVVGGG